KSLDEPVVSRNGFEQLRRREGNVKKKANPLAGPKRAELRGERHQMIIMHPDEVIGPANGSERSCKGAVEALVTLSIRRLEVDQVQPIMAGRPEHLISKTQIIFVVILLRHRDRRDGDVVLGCLRHGKRSALLHDISVPSKPHTANRSNSIAKGYCEPPRLG